MDGHLCLNLKSLGKYRECLHKLIYEKTAEDVAAQICNDFFPLLKALGKFYRD